MCKRRKKLRGGKKRRTKRESLIVEQLLSVCLSVCLSLLSFSLYKSVSRDRKKESFKERGDFDFSSSLSLVGVALSHVGLLDLLTGEKAFVKTSTQLLYRYRRMHAEDTESIQE